MVFYPTCFPLLLPCTALALGILGRLKHSSRVRRENLGSISPAQKPFPRESTLAPPPAGTSAGGRVYYTAPHPESQYKARSGGRGKRALHLVVGSRRLVQPDIRDRANMPDRRVELCFILRPHLLPGTRVSKPLREPPSNPAPLPATPTLIFL